MVTCARSNRNAARHQIGIHARHRRNPQPEVKASIVAECYSGRESVSAVARRHGLDPSQVYAWRRDLRKRLEAEGVVLPLVEPEAVAFVPAVIEPSAVPDPAPTRRPRRRRRTAAAAVELEIDGVAVKIGRDADAGVISAVIEALRATR
ncbi:transposase (plasmid) [Novosphingobium sp. ES2-1]|nr:transposase [Novosphingobium sp. ES2-1]